MNVSIDAILNYVVTNGVSLVINLAASLAIWIIGRRIISILMGVVNRGIVRGGKIDATTSHYITSILSVLLTIGLVLGIFGYLGVQTTSFAALLAGAGIAIDESPQIQRRIAHRAGRADVLQRSARLGERTECL